MVLFDQLVEALSCEHPLKYLKQARAKRTSSKPSSREQTSSSSKPSSREQTSSSKPSSQEQNVLGEEGIEEKKVEEKKSPPALRFPTVDRLAGGGFFVLFRRCACSCCVLISECTIENKTQRYTMDHVNLKLSSCMNVTDPVGVWPCHVLYPHPISHK